ncbi:hypothetical protein HID58_028800 [Brassica napus]|uniref:Uncharacterized protein n=1 Tax=Brassica napus TaxID=3708 RepID=A0ABQ8CBA2_BRANA|nr:hypothetical protein HID58_028800 [Brassica napus]
MVRHVFAQPSEERHTVTVQRCARMRHDRRWSSKCYSRGQNRVYDAMNGHVSSEDKTERLVFNHGVSKRSELRGHLVVVS